MKIPSINQALQGLYAKLDMLSEVKQDDDSVSMYIENDYIVSEKLIDKYIDATKLSLALGIEPSEENLLYVKRLGFSMSSNLQRLLGFILSNNLETQNIDASQFLMSHVEIEELIVDFDINSLLNIAERLDLIFALVRKMNGEYMDMPTRHALGLESLENLQNSMDNATELLKGIGLKISAENLELVDKLAFIQNSSTHDAIGLLENLMSFYPKLHPKDVLEEPALFIKFLKVIHRYDVVIHMEKGPEIDDIIDIFTGQIERYIKFFPIGEREHILDYLQNELTGIGSDFFKRVGKSNIESIFYRRIESDIERTLQFQIDDEFPLLLIPIFSHYEKGPISGELWIKKDSPTHSKPGSTLLLSLSATLKNLDYIEIFIYGIERDIDIYILCKSEYKDIISRHKSSILDIMHKYKFYTGRFEVLDLKSRNVILPHLLYGLIDIDKTFDIKI